jgi:hypothetical protein
MRGLCGATPKKLSGFERMIVNVDKRVALRMARGVASSST